ncbi:hypothetical protein DB35_22670 [Streptomyces abyssalis]|uniref:Uncharacterized protein n=1 Tax=Streptomyces abyssalis TaxID=933944 RepID=A0A1E7JP61_9ACTN|nr:hypothetical protein [Streptomyces abyssalis]OEU86540.1 hypothetical protein DB35_22670 [Streptomyces abyssalis]OEU90071.1 hypothetical protein AN215_10835 [Streptomyces abyssalis]OEV29015.1 hypothetical protein AN219_19005 [Streptomyces nanshensis]
MNDVTSHINASAELASVEITDAEGVVFTDYTPVMGTPGAFLGGVAIASATVAAFEQGQG